MTAALVLMVLLGVGGGFALLCAAWVRDGRELATARVYCRAAFICHLLSDETWMWRRRLQLEAEARATPTDQWVMLVGRRIGALAQERGHHE